MGRASVSSPNTYINQQSAQMGYQQLTLSIVEQMEAFMLLSDFTPLYGMQCGDICKEDV